MVSSSLKSLLHFLSLFSTCYKSIYVHATHYYQYGSVRRHSEKRIVGGTLASSAHEFPGFAFPHVGQCYCGASLIRPNILISAAHCAVLFVDGIQFNIGGSRVDGSNSTDTLAIESMVVHPDFNKSTFANDIMLLKLASPSSAPVFPLNTNHSVPAVDEMVTSIGFGATGLGESCSHDLLKIAVPTIDCFDFYPRAKKDLGTSICAGGNGKVSCSGDSGGPLLTADGSIVGIVSVGHGCNLNPAMHTRVSSFESWIANTISEMSVNDTISTMSTISELSLDRQIVFLDAGSHGEDTTIISSDGSKSYSNSINIVVDENEIPQAVYQTHRYSEETFAYVIPGLKPYSLYSVTVGFAEIYEPNCKVGSRLFDVLVMGAVLVDSLDVFNQAGCYTAHEESGTYEADHSGNITVSFAPGRANNPMVSYIELAESL